MLRFLLNHFIRTVVHDQRGEWSWAGMGGGAMSGASMGSSFGPWGTVIGGVGGAILGGFAGGGEEKEDEDDPLADIRAQLRALSSEVPGLVAREKALIGERFGEAREKGIQDIGESVRGERGFGSSSIEERLKAELIDKLARSQSEAELAAEMKGLQMRSNILGQVGQFTPTEEEPTFGEQLLGIGGELLGTELGYGRLEKLLGTQKSPTEDTEEEIKKRPSIITA